MSTLTQPVPRRRRPRSRFPSLSDDQRGQLYDAARERAATISHDAGNVIKPGTGKPIKRGQDAAQDEQLAKQRQQMIGALAHPRLRPGEQVIASGDAVDDRATMRSMMRGRLNTPGPVEVNRTGNRRSGLNFQRVALGPGKEMHDYPGTANDTVVKKQRTSSGSTAGASTTPTRQLKRKRKGY